MWQLRIYEGQLLSLLKKMGFGLDETCPGLVDFDIRVIVFTGPADFDI